MYQILSESVWFCRRCGKKHLVYFFQFTVQIDVHTVLYTHVLGGSLNTHSWLHCVGQTYGRPTVSFNVHSLVCGFTELRGLLHKA